MEENRQNDFCNIVNHGKRLESIEDTVLKIYDRLFVSNGKQSIIDQLKEHKDFIDSIKWGVKIAMIPVIAGIAGFLLWAVASYAK